MVPSAFTSPLVLTLWLGDGTSSHDSSPELVYAAAITASQNVVRHHQSELRACTAQRPPTSVRGQ
jgi:hypothetical protein